jgi:hypothetical protein
MGAFEGMTSALRPTIRANQRLTLGAASLKDGATAWSAGCSEEGAGSGEEGRAAPGTAFLISWTTNLWRGDRLDDMTLNRAPLIEHLNSTSLSSIASG